jgi:hypothetical protein
MGIPNSCSAVWIEGSSTKIAGVSAEYLGLSIFLRLLVEVEGKRERDVEESELIIFFFEGVLAGVGKACSAEVWGMWCAEVRGSESSESKGEIREAAFLWERAAFFGEGLGVPGEEGESVLLDAPGLADTVAWRGGGVVWATLDPRWPASLAE